MSGAFKRERHPNIKQSESDPILPFTVAWACMEAVRPR